MCSPVYGFQLPTSPVNQQGDGQPGGTPLPVCYGDLLDWSVWGYLISGVTNWGAVTVSPSGGCVMSADVPSNVPLRDRITFILAPTNGAAWGSPVMDGDAVNIFMAADGTYNSVLTNGGGSATSLCPNCEGNCCGWYYMAVALNFHGDPLQGHSPVIIDASSDYEDADYAVFYIREYTSACLNPTIDGSGNSGKPVLYGDQLVIGNTRADNQSYFLMYSDPAATSDFYMNDIDCSASKLADTVSPIIFQNANGQIPTQLQGQGSCNGAPYTCQPGDPYCQPGPPPTCSNGCPIKCGTDCTCSCPDCTQPGGGCGPVSSLTCNPASDCYPPLPSGGGGGCINGNPNPTCTGGQYDCTFPPTSTTTIVLIVVGSIAGLAVLALIMWGIWRALYGKSN